MSILDLHYAYWDQEVVSSNTPVVVEFWHQSCPLCKKIESTVIRLPAKLGERAKLVRLNVMDSRENRRLAIDKGVVGTPTFKVYCGGVEVGEIVGLETTENLLGTIENLLKNCA
ncbi:MAG: thioredoxin family protein [Candidatus Bathyarchaeota archaeon]|nr:thioredoxin family protein [Candidatus Bathyarchaeota archaeon]